MALTDIECAETRGRCHIHGAALDSERLAHRAEVRALQRRIDALESALAVAETAKQVKVVAFQRSSERSAVTQVNPHSPAGLDAEPQPVADPAESDSANIDPAEIWCAEQDSFEERLAARAFFSQDAVDEPARRWFLNSL